MIDKDTLRIARRTVERNGYTVLPPRDQDERELDRFRNRQRVERDYNRFEDDDDRTSRFNREDDRQSRFKPLRSDNDSRRAPAPRYREIVDDERPRFSGRREMNDDEKLGAAIRTAEENGFTIRKMSKLDQAKQVARDNGFDVRKIDRTPVAANTEGSNDRPPRRVATRDGAPIRRPVLNREFSRTRQVTDVHPNTKPDVDETPKANTQQTTETPKKPTFEDDYVNRAAAFFGDEA